jgi:hypothetical protein
MPGVKRIPCSNTSDACQSIAVLSTITDDAETLVLYDAVTIKNTYVPKGYAGIAFSTENESEFPMKKSRSRDPVCIVVSTALCTSLLACGGGRDARLETHAASTPCEASNACHAPAPHPPLPDPCGGNPGDYTVGLTEEFEGSLDRKLWNDREWYNPIVTTTNFEVSNGSLKLWLQRNQEGKFFSRILSTSPRVLEGSDPTRTGYMQRYGCFQIGARLPSGKGQFPAFWLFTPDGREGHPEIDIMEAFPRDALGDARRHPIAYVMTTHVGCTSADPNCDMRFHSKLHDTKTLFAQQDLSAGFHTYALKWEPDRLTYYFDGKPIHTTLVRMADPMYILLDTKPDPGSPPDDTTPTKRGNTFDAGAIFEVNYLRTWCLKSLGCK